MVPCLGFSKAISHSVPYYIPSAFICICVRLFTANSYNFLLMGLFVFSSHVSVFGCCKGQAGSFRKLGLSTNVGWELGEYFFQLL